MQTRGMVPVLYDNVDKIVYAVLGKQIRELQYPWHQYLNERTSQKKFERVASVVAFGDVPEKGEGADYTLDSIRAGWTTDFTHLEYGMGFKHTQPAKEDDQYDIVVKASQWLGFSARYSEAKLAANVLNNGFTATTGTLAPDTNPLFYATHVLKGGGTASNVPTSMADLSVTSLSQAIIDVQVNTKLESGQLGLPITSWKLVIPPHLELLAHRLIASAGLPSSADNDVNPIRALRNISIVVDPLLTDTDAWFLVAADKSLHGLVCYTRVPIGMEPPYIDAAGNTLYRVRYRKSFGAELWQNVYGNQGA